MNLDKFEQLHFINLFLYDRQIISKQIFTFEIDNDSGFRFIVPFKIFSILNRSRL